MTDKLRLVKKLVFLLSTMLGFKEVGYGSLPFLVQISYTK